MRTRAFAVGFLALVLGASCAWAETKIEKVNKKDGVAIVDFRYTNDSDSTLSIVKIECNPPGAKSRREKGIINLNNHLDGGISPGHSERGQRRVPLPKGAEPSDVNCADQGRALIQR